MKLQKPTLPRVGIRTVKTVISATLIAILYGLVGRNPCFACIGAVFGMGNMFSGGLKSGGNRFVGTFIGGLLAIPFYQLYHHPPLPYLPAWVYLGAGLFLVLYVSQIFSANNAIQPGTVVFFVVILTVPESTYMTYTFNRVIDTGIGVAFSLLINRLHRPPLDRLAASAPQAESEKGKLGHPPHSCADEP